MAPLTLSHSTNLLCSFLILIATTMKLESITIDVFKHILSFANSATIASLARTSKNCYLITRKFYLDTVRHVAIIDSNRNYHIKYISSQNKQNKSKDLIKMICIDNTNQSIQYLLQNSINANSCTWAKFVSKKYRLQRLMGANNIKGYWKLLDINKDNIIKDLNAIKSLVMHKQIAPKLLAYTSKNNENHFNVDKITVIINNNKYDILFWNGASPNQCNAFQIYNHQKNKVYFFMNFRSDIQHIKWAWYDNDSLQFMQYSLGAKVKLQIECSFQANLLHNFPMEFQEDVMFDCVSLPELKKGLINRFGNNSRIHKNKLFALIIRFDDIDDPNRLIQSICQSSISLKDFAKFLRPVQRVECDDLHKSNGFYLRMMPYIVKHIDS
eukprot:417913_1